MYTKRWIIDLTNEISYSSVLCKIQQVTENLHKQQMGKHLALDIKHCYSAAVLSILTVAFPFPNGQSFPSFSIGKLPTQTSYGKDSWVDYVHLNQRKAFNEIS